MAKKRRNIAFSLSFLDIMACGFGAVTLLFLILRHNATEVITPDENLAAEVDLLQMDIRQATEERGELLNSLEKIKSDLVAAQGLSARVITELEEQENSIQEDSNDLDKLRQQVEQIEEESAQMEEIEFGDSVRKFSGDGVRQYLTGLKLGGERILILVDGSASMLADNLVNVNRRMLLNEKQKQQSPKWQWTLRTVEWLLAQLPPSSRYQVYIFNAQATAVISESEGVWLDSADPLSMDISMARLSDYVPNSGTSLINAFNVIAEFDQQTDNIYILTDGLPTMGEAIPKKFMVTGRDRIRHFNVARKKIPPGVSINTILFPMEGDYKAAALYWQLAVDTEGAFIAPSRDWP